jgi:hypothetical protein
MEYVGMEVIMTRDAIDAFIEKENKAADFLTRYHTTRKDTDPLLHIAYAVQELIQIVKWLRIEIDRVSVTKVIPTLHQFICVCGHSRNIHLSNDGMCCSNSNGSFDCHCLGFDENETS